MAKFTTTVIPILPNPKDYPANILKKVRKKVKNYLTKDAAPMLIRDLKDTVQGWSTPPTFVSKYSEPHGTRLQIDVFPTGSGALNWKRVSVGTGPRQIRAKSPRGMRFQRDYTPKTTAGGRYGGPGIKHGAWTTAFTVTHSIEPRNFTILIKDKREDKLHDDLERIVHKIAKT